jgi:hypothetical protein
MQYRYTLEWGRYHHMYHLNCVVEKVNTEEKETYRKTKKANQKEEEIQAKGAAVGGGGGSYWNPNEDMPKKNELDTLTT